MQFKVILYKRQGAPSGRGRAGLTIGPSAEPLAPPGGRRRSPASCVRSPAPASTAPPPASAAPPPASAAPPPHPQPRPCVCSPAPCISSSAAHRQQQPSLLSWWSECPEVSLTGHHRWEAPAQLLGQVPGTACDSYLLSPGQSEATAGTGTQAQPPASTKVTGTRRAPAGSEVTAPSDPCCGMSRNFMNAFSHQHTRPSNPRGQCRHPQRRAGKWGVSRCARAFTAEKHRKSPQEKSASERGPHSRDGEASPPGAPRKCRMLPAQYITSRLVLK